MQSDSDEIVLEHDEDNEAEANVSYQITNGPTKQLTRKRIRDIESWKRNKCKRSRHLGIEYTNAQGKVVAARRMGDVCSDKCRLKCFTKITNDERRQIFDYYWKLGNVDLKRSFLNNSMSEINSVYRMTKPGSTLLKIIDIHFPSVIN